MRRFSILFIVLGLIIISTASSHAQTGRGLGAGALVIDDYFGHTITQETPQHLTSEWNAWQTPAVSNLTWYSAPPPANGSQAGFVLSGPLTGGVVPELAYWLPPGITSLNGGGLTGGLAGAWDHATFTQLGIGAGGGFIPAYMNVYNDGDYTVPVNAAEVFDQFPQLVGFVETNTSEFTATNAGTYNVEYTGSTITGSTNLAIAVNGVVAQSSAFGCATATVIIHGNAILTLHAGDYIQLVNNASASAVDLKPQGTSNGASMSAVRIQ